MKTYIKHIVEDFDFNAVQNPESAADTIVNAAMERLQCVDMGLPSGTLWAKYNVGAKPLLKQPENQKDWYGAARTWYGDYFAFGEVAPKDVYDYASYKWIIDENSYKHSEFMKKYYYPEWKYKKVDLYDDAAFINTKGLFVMPTDEQYDELIKNCKITREQHYNGIGGLHGRLFTSKINGNTLFFPEADIKSDRDTTYENVHNNNKNICYYWSATLTSCGTSTCSPEALMIDEDNYGHTHVFTCSFDHSAGLPVRGVINKK
jgi:hypothetical protein